MHLENEHYKREIEELKKIVRENHENLKRKDKLIDDIIHNIYSQDTSLQLVVMKPYRGKTVVYKDGKRLDTENTTGVDVCIDELGHVDATIRNE